MDYAEENSELASSQSPMYIPDYFHSSQSIRSTLLRQLLSLAVGCPAYAYFPLFTVISTSDRRLHNSSRTAGASYEVKSTYPPPFEVTPPATTEPSFEGQRPASVNEAPN